ncbi:riboflavin synthase alpha chain [Candidatus Nitrososphaera gargensis Ga9.2]|uniref:Riboflavin synthase n=1 Tax=Nitrososphaera gargensis (strain Ga9.2) TaxID=1237085 RepID=K0IL68_NITGG|nr:riboflavin synthase [Candidatus Nitrososphaera gargensis]AFU60183.1 riboflavin synthase alpha chain [Candidatus Nitrososphaera gargensis Ga9.2]
MFTGIVEGMGRVRSVSKSKRGADTIMRVSLGRLGRSLKRGDSVCINGACLTVTKLSKGEAEFEMVAETIRRTNLGKVKAGDKVNIERSMKVGDRLEGHFVLGHVDGTGIIEDIQKLPSETKLWIKLDKGLAGSLVSKGSIAVDGVSLTLVDIDGDRVSVSLIPHTLSVTTLGLRRKGDRVNIETDILGKYVASNLPK